MKVCQALTELRVLSAGVRRNGSLLSLLAILSLRNSFRSAASETIALRESHRCSP